MPLCPKLEPPLGGRAGAFHRSTYCFGLRVHIALGHGKIAMAGQISERVRIHMSCPARETGVTERVQREVFDSGQFTSSLVLGLGR